MKNNSHYDVLSNQLHQSTLKWKKQQQ